MLSRPGVSPLHWLAGVPLLAQFGCVEQVPDTCGAYRAGFSEAAGTASVLVPVAGSATCDACPDDISSGQVTTREAVRRGALAACEAGAAGDVDCEELAERFAAGVRTTGIDAACPTIDDRDDDGVGKDEDCSDDDTAFGARALDQDCDGAVTTADCDDTDAQSTIVAEDADCDGARTADDCDDGDPTRSVRSDDRDCDGVVGEQDCDDTDAAVGTSEVDSDCDLVPTVDDCDDHDAAMGARDLDHDCDGSLTSDDCDDEDASVYPGARETWYDGTDADCAGDDDNDQDHDGVVVAVDCDDTDALRGPPTPETLNGVDDDCNGQADDVSLSDAATSHYITTRSDDVTGRAWGPAPGGDVRFILPDEIGGPPAALYVGTSTALSRTGTWTASTLARVTLGSSDLFVEYVAPTLTDHDDDGQGDAAVLLRRAGSGGGSAVVIPGSALGGTSVTSETSVWIADSTYNENFDVIATGDIDGDGLRDATLIHHQGLSGYGRLEVFSGLSDGLWALADGSASIQGTYGTGRSLKIQDFDGDGYDDMLVGESTPATVRWLPGNTGARWSSTVASSSQTDFVGYGGDAVWDQSQSDVRDLDGDGALDLVLTQSGTGDVVAFMAFASLRGTHASSTADVRFALAGAQVTSSDADGDGIAELWLGHRGALYRFDLVGASGTLDATDASAVVMSGLSPASVTLYALGGEDVDGDGSEDLLVSTRTSSGDVYAVRAPR